MVYWSGTGNTEAMACAVADGIKSAGGEAVMLKAAEFDESMIDSFDSVAFGCPSMGTEELEESEFAPMFESCEAKLSGKKIALFGSYGWGTGEWMENWENDCKGAGASLVCDSVICNNTPDDEGLMQCEALGAALA